MLEKLMKLYVAAMLFEVRSPMPHLVGPPGCGKSTNVEMLAELLGVELHVINVSRLSPLEVEGVQMPHGTGEDMVLKMLPATFWTTLKEGDILLMDEFLRGFPEVYSGLLDIFTSRRVGAFRLPSVFIIGASNSVIAYDSALEDRLLHIPVADPRRSTTEAKRLAKLLVDDAGLLPEIALSSEMDDVLNDEVLPTYGLLDSFKKNGRKVGTVTDGTSLRNLIGQIQLRHVESTSLKALVDANNHAAMAASKPQFVVLLGGASSQVPRDYEDKARALLNSPKLGELQRRNIQMNLQLIEMEAAVHEEDTA